MDLINTTNFIGQSIYYITNSITGAEYLTILLIGFFLFFVLLAFRTPFPIAIIILFPFFLIAAAINSIIMVILGVLIFILAVYLTVNFFIK